MSAPCDVTCNWCGETYHIGSTAELELHICRERKVHAQIERLRKDAERYRWLVSNFTRCGSVDMSGKHSWTGIGRTIGEGVDVHEAIDEAMGDEQ